MKLPTHNGLDFHSMHDDLLLLEHAALEEADHLLRALHLGALIKDGIAAALTNDSKACQVVVHHLLVRIVRLILALDH